MLLYLINNKQQGLCSTSVSKTAILQCHDAPYPSHLFFFSSCWSECSSFLHPFGSSLYFSSPAHYVGASLLSFVPPPLCPVTPGSHQWFSRSILHIAVRSEWFLLCSCRFLPSRITIVSERSISPSAVSYALPLSRRLFPWWVTCRHFHASSLVHVAAAPSTGLDSHFSIKRAATFISILRRINIYPAAVCLGILQKSWYYLFTLMSF